MNDEKPTAAAAAAADTDEEEQLVRKFMYVLCGLLAGVFFGS